MPCNPMPFQHFLLIWSVNTFVMRVKCSFPIVATEKTLKMKKLLSNNAKVVAHNHKTFDLVVSMSGMAWRSTKWCLIYGGDEGLCLGLLRFQYTTKDGAKDTQKAQILGKIMHGFCWEVFGTITKQDWAPTIVMSKHNHMLMVRFFLDHVQGLKQDL